MSTSKSKIENVALIYVELPNSDVELDMFELSELIRTAQGKVCLTCSQKRNSIDVANVLGKGKLDEIKHAIELCDNQIDVAVFSCTLNSTQRKVLTDILGVDVIDKIDLILDIFALRATSAEGKKQVELAQLTYNLATKPEGDFSRQGAGIGTRGPGETKLETNKRLARARIHNLKLELDEIEKRRQVTRKLRQDNDLFTVALVGYTNAGKSTLFNRLAGENIYADNKLFATLDTTIRKILLPCGVSVLLCDTVGFIRELPHTLLNAFKSTLEETKFADLIVNVCDINDNNVDEHIAVTEDLLNQLDVSAPMIRVYNKCDLLNDMPIGNVNTTIPMVFASATTGKNIDVLLQLIQDEVMKIFAKINMYAKYGTCEKLISQLAKYTDVYNVTYDNDGAKITATLRRKYVDLFANYIVF